jgi:hypothetical protein
MRVKLHFLILLIVYYNLSCEGLKASEKNDTIRNANDSLSNKANSDDSLSLTPYHLNVIKFNPTPMVLFDEIRNVTFSFERLINKHNSIALQLGYLVIPQVLNDTLFNNIALDKYTRKGINAAIDYRMYPFSRNRRPAPDGLYIGGYLSYYGTSFENKVYLLDATDTDNVMLNGRINMINLGFEMGYQFIFAKKFSIDLLMFGPSLSGYSANLGITGNLNSELADKIDEELAAKLKERYPALGYLFSDESSTFSTSKIEVSSWFRYSIQFGYHF